MGNFGPVPVETLNYLPPRPAGRPGIITAIGVLSIVIALFSGMTSLVLGFQAFGFYMLTKMSAMVPPTPPPATAPVGIVQDPADGMDPSERRMVVAVLARLHPEMSVSRREHLDALLARTGRTMFQMRGAALTSPAIRASVSRDGRIPSARGDADGEYFVLPSGRVEIYDEHAMFDPGFGRQRVSASAAGSIGVATTQPAAAMSAPPPLPKINVSGAIASAAIAESAASIGLSIFLFISGIMVLNNSPRGAKLHRVYAVVKILLAIVAGVVMWMLWSQVFNSMMSAAGPQFRMGALTGAWAVVGSLVSCVYPVALLIVLRTRAVRSYYDPVER